MLHQAVSALDRVREVAREKKGERFTTLLHHIDATLLRQAYYWLKRDAAPGVAKRFGQLWLTPTKRRGWNDLGRLRRGSGGAVARP